MRSNVCFFIGVPLLGGFAQISYAQNNSELTPFVDARVGGILLGNGRGCVDNDADLLVARERFDGNFGAQSLYFRSFDGTNDVERLHFDVVLVNATVQNTFSDFFSVASGDFFVGVGDINSDYGGFNNSRGIEGTDVIVRATDNRSFGSFLTSAGGIDDFRVAITFDDLDPGNNVNRGSAFAQLTMYAGGAKSPLMPNFQSGTNLGAQVGETLFDVITGDGDYSAGANIEPEGNGGFNNPSRQQDPIILVLLFEDLDIVQDLVAFPLTDPGASTPVLSYTVDNFAQGVDIDNDNFADTNGTIDAVPNLSLERMVFVAPDLLGPGGVFIPKSAIQASANLGTLDVGDSNAFSISVNVPANTPGGTYTGQGIAFEDNNNNGIFDANETGDTVTIQVDVRNQNPPDADNDGLDNDEEDINGNGVVDPGETNPNNPDSDSDGLLDGTEVNGQNPTNPLDSDSDNDGLLDGAEDTNKNGQHNGNETDPNDPDTDNGGEADGSEVSGGRDPLDPSDDLTFNPNGDDDADGLRNGLEDKNGNGVVDAGETDAQNPDSDQDALGDGEEDADHDGIRDPDETNPLDSDSDDDALPDGTELLGANPTDPLRADTDGDGLQDGCEDQDHNGALNNQELNPKLADTDDDGLPDGAEDTNGNCSVDAGETDGTDADTDNGGELDGSEVDAGRDPFDPADDVLGPPGSIYEIGGGSCAVQSTESSSLWGLVFAWLAVVLLLRKPKRSRKQ
jgi:hypothetical protein